MSLTKVSYSMISGAVINVLDLGASNDGTNASATATALQAAIDQANTDGGGVVFFPSGTYDIGSTTLVMKTGVTLRGEGNNASVIKSSSFVLDYGSWADGGTQNTQLYSLQLWCTGTDGCIVLRGRPSGTSVTGDVVAFDVYFKNNNSIVIDETTFTYSGFWNIDRCIFQAYLHLSTSSNLNGAGFGMLVNTIRITNSTFGTVGSLTDYMIKFASVANPTGVNQTLIQGCVFEKADGGGVQYIAGQQHAFLDNWFFDATSSYNAIRIESGASFISIKNVFARDAGGANISNASAGPVVIENCNITTGSTLNPSTSSQPARITSTFTPISGPLLWGFNNNGDSIYLSTNKVAGMQAINILLPPTLAAGTIAIPVPAQYTDSLFNLITAFKLKNGDTALSDPGATHDVSIRCRAGSPSATLFSWTNANTAVSAYEEILLNDSGAYNSTDYTDFLDSAGGSPRPFLYVDITKNGAGQATGYMYLTLYVM
jgi:hypothetical protein